jgi:hypothetical protein
MKKSRWDRIYIFVFSSASFAVASFMALLVIPTVEIPATETREAIQLTLLDNGEIGQLLINLFPVILTVNALFAVPKDGIPDKAAKINLWVSLFVIYLFIALQINAVGILFAPTAILMTAAAVGAQVRRRKRTVFATSPEESKSGKGGGKRRRKKG